MVAERAPLGGFLLLTFGCKVNQYESQALSEAWTDLGGHEVGEPEKARWIVVNTCAVTAEAVSDARQAVRRLHRLAPAASILVTGCAASVADGDFTALPGVAAVVGQQDKTLLLRGPKAITREEITREELAREENGRPAAAVPGPDFAIRSFARARPVLKVQDGCTQGCAYCVVPLARGRARSRPPREVLAEAERLLASGSREIVLSGINLRQYRAADGRDALRFWDLVALLDRELAPRWNGRARLRISSLDPAQLDQRALATLAASRLVCPHLHLSLQSGSPSVLRRMGRAHYDPAAVRERIEAVRTFWPLFGLGADIMVGFPGESEEEHRQSLDFVRSLPLSYAHVFAFSGRPGTAAARLPDLPCRIKRERARTMRELMRARRREFFTQVAQRPRLVLAPDAPGTARDREVRGVSEYYAACRLRAGSAAGRSLLPVRPVGVEEDCVLVEAVA